VVLACRTKFLFKSVFLLVLLAGLRLSACGQNHPPQFDNCPQEWLAFTCTEMAEYDFDASDPDPGDQVRYFLGPGTGGAIDSLEGRWEWGHSGSTGIHDFSIIARDQQGDSAVCEFSVLITTSSPTFVGCPEDSSATTVVIGGLIEGSVSAIDPDECPSPITYTLVEFDGPGMMEVDPDHGMWSWRTHMDDEYEGQFGVVIEASDGAMSDTCQFTITVLPDFKIWIGAELEQPQGQYVELPIFVSDETDYMAGYDFLIEYDGKMLTFVEASLGYDLGVDGCCWEYFTYRYVDADGCGGQCPADLIRLVAIAEHDLQPPLPLCYGGTAIELAKLRFFVSGGTAFQCKFSPVRFYWLDCGDNAISSVSGDTLWLSSEVYYLDVTIDSSYVDVTGQYGIGGHTGLDSVNCLEGNIQGSKPADGIILRGGGIKTECLTDLMLYGDLNMNRVPNEISDAVLYIAYFMVGLEVFTIDPPTQMESSDVNRDGRILTSGDLVYMIRVISGFPDEAGLKLNHFAHGVEILERTQGESVDIELNSETDIGAIYMTFDLSDAGATVELLADEMDMEVSWSGSELRILVYSMSASAIPAGETDLVRIHSGGRVVLTGSSVSDADGALMHVVNTSSESAFGGPHLVLEGVSPNPFNDETLFRFYLSHDSDWTISIYNLAGQTVDRIDGRSETGLSTVEWSPHGLPSGVYFYRLQAGANSAKGKMLHLK
jgi:hypothetical protein